ncbi:MAG TPA: IclR family transcriptional regulator [Bacillales bacterium]|nr:IclR family transcriptional regulator [Bacillales bacterium]
MVQSIDRAMDIIQVLISEDNRRTWSISEIADIVGLPASSVHRLLGSLVKHGLVEKAPETKRYQIGYTWMEIGYWLHERLDFRQTARPFMEQLAADTRETVYLSVPTGDSAVIVERIDSPDRVRIIDNIGERIPMHIGAANKSMLAFMEEMKRTQIIESLQQITKIQGKELMEQLSQIKNRGYAVSFGEKTPGTASIAAPVINRRQDVVGAVYINFVRDETANARFDEWTTKVREAARLVSASVGKAF